jgi:hypothetical protein
MGVAEIKQNSRRTCFIPRPFYAGAAFIALTADLIVHHLRRNRMLVKLALGAFWATRRAQQ